MRYPYRVVVDDNVDRLQVYSRWRHSRAILITRTFTLSGDYFHWLSVVVKQRLRSIGIKKLKGVYGKGDPPLPIPNREVKPFSADGTADRWESRKMPNLDGESYRDVTLSFFCVLSFVSRLLFSFRLFSSCVLCTCSVFFFVMCVVRAFLVLCFLLLFSVFCCFLRGFAFFSLLYSLLHSLLSPLLCFFVIPFFLLSFFLFVPFQPCCGSLLSACLACFCLPDLSFSLFIFFFCACVCWIRFGYLLLNLFCFDIKL